MEVIIIVPEHPKTVNVGSINFLLDSTEAVVGVAGVGGDQSTVDTTAILAALDPGDKVVIEEFFKDIIAEALTIDKGDLTGDVF